MRVERLGQLTAHNGAVYALARGRTSGSLFSAGADRVVAEWDLKTGETNPFAIRLDATIYSLLNIEGRLLVIGTSRGSMHVIDLDSREEVRHLKLHDKGIFYLMYDKVNDRVYAACADGSVSVWDPNEWSLLWHLRLTDQKVRRLALNESASLLAVACGDGRCLLIETGEHSIVHEIEAHAKSTNSLAFLPGGDLVTGGKDAFLRVWNSRDDFACKQEIPAHNYAIYDIVVNASQRWIATASRDKTVKIWDLALSMKPQRLDRVKNRGHIHSVNALLWLEDENLLASCSDDRSVITWRIHPE